MAVGIEQLAGPVSPGDIIMKNEQAPRGAAALLNKMINKGTQGMYKLPEPEKEIPGFMKDAMENMEEVKLDSSDFRTILKLLEQGFSMEDIQGMTQASMLQDKAKTLNEAAPEGEKLAYINADEAGVLKLLGGSGEMTPAGIPSFKVAGNFKMGGVDYSSPSQSDMNKEKDPIEQRKQAAQSMASMGLTSAGDVVSSDAKEQQKIINYYQDRERDKDNNTGGMSNQLAEVFGQTQAAKSGALDFDTSTKTGEKLAGISAQNFAKDILSSGNAEENFLNSERGQEILDLIGDFTPLTGNVGLEDLNLLGVFKNVASNFGKDEEDRLTREDGEMTREGFFKKLGEIEGGRDTFFNLVKRFDPENFYKVVGMPQTSGGLEEMSKVQMLSTDGIDRSTPEGKKRYNEIKRFNAQIMEARDKTQSKGNNNKSSGGGSAAAPPADTPADDMPEPDPRAGQFNVGGDMPYTSDRTGGVEMNVPLGRRFQIDRDGKFRGQTPFTMDDVMKYATEGGFQQLEPFQEYLTRRKKFLGEEDPEYFDEEGNVIYGGPQ